MSTIKQTITNNSASIRSTNQYRGSISNASQISGQTKEKAKITGKMINSISIPIASETVLGGIKIDPSTLEITSDGVLSVKSRDDIFFATTETWTSKPKTIAEKDVIYVYTDYNHTEDGQNIPGIKIGNGAYLIDTPFVDALYADHIMNTVIHVTEEEKNFWNNKVTCFADPNNENRVIFTKLSEEDYNNG